ncbi:hypothetical protein [Streptomyces sp. UG1]|uniref:hypothetical protein n=1 Tax=Streptomyces sp. UG1 TaxID=3417652 RepID=UPI003CE74EA7
MDVTGGRRLWRWALVVWVILVAVAGGATLWLRDSAEPPGPYRWENAGPTPSLPERWRSACPTPDEDGEVLCFVRTR